MDESDQPGTLVALYLGTILFVLAVVLGLTFLFGSVLGFTGPFVIPVQSLILLLGFFPFIRRFQTNNERKRMSFSRWVVVSVLCSILASFFQFLVD